jgi:DNA-binding protein HU-beta
VNKSELITSIAEKSGLTKKDAEKALKAFTESVQDTLSNNDKVQLVGFGTFEVRARGERKGRNPKTLEEITIPASKAPVFKAGKELKETVNK